MNIIIFCLIFNYNLFCQYTLRSWISNHARLILLENFYSLIFFIRAFSFIKFCQNFFLKCTKHNIFYRVRNLKANHYCSNVVWFRIPQPAVFPQKRENGYFFQKLKYWIISKVPLIVYV